MEKQNQEKKLVGVKLMKTKAGKGYKLVVGDKWFYTSIPELMEMVEGDTNACVFRTIEEDGYSPSPFPSFFRGKQSGKETFDGGDEE